MIIKEISFRNFKEHAQDHKSRQANEIKIEFGCVKILPSLFYFIYIFPSYHSIYSKMHQGICWKIYNM